MSRSDAFGRILEALHLAAVDAAHWPAATALIEEAAGASASNVAVAEGLDGDARIHFARYLYRGQSHPERVREYFDVYHAHNEGVPRIRRLPHGQLAHGPDLYTEDERKTSPAYNEGLRLVCYRNGLIARFDGPDGLRIVWGLGDPVGSDGWGSAELGLIEGVLPHLHRAVVIRQALAAAEAQGATLAGLLDNSRIGVMHLDGGCGVVAANAPALAVLRSGDGLSDSGGVLHAVRPDDRARLRELLGRALPWLSGGTPEGGSMTVRRASDATPLGLHVSPVGAAQGDFGGRRVAALALVVDPARRPQVDAQRVSEAFGLKASEGRVAALLAEGRGVPEIAGITGFRPGYVRVLLKRVYKKLGVSGQVAVVPRILALEALPRR